VNGTEVYGADQIPEAALRIQVVRSPYDHARFHFGNLETFLSAYPQVAAVLTAADIPGKNCYGVIPNFADQPVFAETVARFRGEAVAAVVASAEFFECFDCESFPITWEPLPAITDIDGALAPGAELLHPHREQNVLVRGRVARGNVEQGFREAAVIVEAEYETGFVEHAHIEPEAGFACRVGDTIEIQACTQSPYMDRAEVAAILGIPQENRPDHSDCSGWRFGAKLDLSVQPFIALAAWKLNRRVRMVYLRHESILCTTKRHPAKMRMRVGATSEGKLLAVEFSAHFNTGAYSSWEPTVAARVPVHASGPYYVPHYRALTRAVHTHLVPAGAFRGFGVPQAAIAQEQVYDELADRLDKDRLEFRIINALDNSTPTVTGQVLGEGVGIRSCFEALRPKWQKARLDAEEFNSMQAGPLRRGVGIAGMWYGCGNTSLPNPSTIRVGLKRNGRIALHQGTVDIGQGSNTIVTQICAHALGVAVHRFDLVAGDTSITPDCGKTSASRQTFVSGKAVEIAGRELRSSILSLAGVTGDGEISLGDGVMMVRADDRNYTISLQELPLDRHGYVLTREGYFDPPTSPLDENGQGIPYAVFGFGAHMAEIEVDTDLGTIRVLKVTAAHDVGRAINPNPGGRSDRGGVAQGLGMALMEEFFPGKGENLHDYLIPSAGDVPSVESILIENPSSLGPFGAKGIGEQSVIPTAPAILNAIYDAVGVRIHRVPATPDRVRAAILAKRSEGVARA
jgi:aldehyde oxidoreductase